MSDDAIRGYAATADTLIPRYRALDPAALYGAFVDRLPAPPAGLLDVGAGPGRDAAWFAARGHAVLAVEPVASFRAAGSAPLRSPGVTWLDDRPPSLARVRERGERYPIILLSGVWQHLDADRRPRAMASLAALLAPAGRLVLSVRHGPGASERPCFPTTDAETEALAAGNGLRVAHREERNSIQPANRAAAVRWTWYLFAPDPAQWRGGLGSTGSPSAQGAISS